MAGIRTIARLFSECRRWQRGLAALLLLAAVALPGFAGSSKPPKQDGRHQIDQLEEVWRQAILKSDVKALDNLLADDFMAISANGTLQTKDQLLDQIRSGRIHVTYLSISDRKVRFYGKTALVTSKSHMEGTNVEGDLIGNYRYTRVYVKSAAGDWKIVSFEVSRIRSPKPRH